ncbi:MAG: lipopolysaccharide kinase InaA family protein, partial [Gemmataceae bacterium]
MKPSRLMPDPAPDAAAVPPVGTSPPLASILSQNEKRRVKRLLVHARYRERLADLGLTRAEHFLSLPGLIVSGHVDRNVSRVLLGVGPRGLPAYLKREHSRPWKEMLVNWLSGFGWISRSRREARMLQDARNAGVAVPDWLAAGEDEQGRAFLLVRALKAVRDLREYLVEFAGSIRERRSFARRLGAELARMHDQGFEHRDLYANHLLIDSEGRIQIIDWQRARRWRFPLSWNRRLHELACVDATLEQHTASRTDRLACLRAYVAETHLPLRRHQLTRI